LAGGWDRAESLRLLQHAFEAGYRHFDVAPSYGHGETEALVGTALKSQRQVITLATKVGITPRRTAALLRPARALARRLLHGLPGLRKAIVSQIPSGLVQRNAMFSADAVARSLQASLHALQTDYVDLLLLHEVRRHDLTDELLSFLDAQRQKGTCLAIGTATGLAETKLIQAEYGAFFDAWQHEFDICNPASEPLPFCTILHRTHFHGFIPLKTRLQSDAELCQAISEALGTDLSDPASLSCALLGAALAINPQGLVLIASRKPEHILANAQAAADNSTVEIGEKLLHFLRNEKLSRSAIGASS
jgi:aryl-alcohol dehydrogenase-like predicted oxidoreductase